MKESTRLTNEVLNYLQSSDSNGTFPQYNGPQLSSIGAALTRKLTMIQGPPGKMVKYLVCIDTLRNDYS